MKSSLLIYRVPAKSDSPNPVHVLPKDDVSLLGSPSCARGHSGKGEKESAHTRRTDGQSGRRPTIFFDLV